jgi:hypothetical protein
MRVEAWATYLLADMDFHSKQQYVSLAARTRVTGDTRSSHWRHAFVSLATRIRLPGDTREFPGHRSACTKRDIQKLSTACCVEVVRSITAFTGGTSMSENKAVTVVTEPPPLAPRALAGAILGADLGLFAFIGAHASYGSTVLGFLFTLIPAAGMAGVVALAAYIIQQRRGSLSRLNRDLTNLNSLMGRRLIDEEDYLMLKRRVIDDYQPQQLNVSSIVKPALWAALMTSLTLLTLAGASMWAPVQSFFASMILPAIGGAAVSVVGTNIVHRLRWPRQHPELPSGEPVEWQALGTRPSLPSKK